MTTSRLEAFSDGVLAIAITLLVFELRPPALHQGERLAHGLWRQWPSYVAYLVSFLTIGSLGTLQGERADDERAGADPACDESLAGQSVIGRQDGVAGDLEALGQLAAGRERLARAEPAVQDGRPDLLVDPGGPVACPAEGGVDLHDRDARLAQQKLQVLALVVGR